MSGEAVTTGGLIRLYHVSLSDRAMSIQADGFRDGERYVGGADDGTPIVVRGVWFSDAPCWDGGYADPPDGWQVVRITIPLEVAEPFEIIDKGCPYREWCLPSAIANQYLLK